jgi:hypothetical protein
MPLARISLFEGRPLLDIASYARGGPGARKQLSPAEIAQISRTIKRVPEVVIKVLPKHTNDLNSVARHIGYIGRHGDVDLETDDGDRLSGKGVGRQLLDDWDLDLNEHRGYSRLGPLRDRNPPKLVHKLMFSMPPGTPPGGLHAAVRNFLREEFALKHRYAFVLHTDEPHPHVHAVVKAVSEQGVRLNIRKATLRQWREQFARELRDQGIQANATERAVRGAVRTHKRDGIYRAACRSSSTHVRQRIKDIAAGLLNGGLRAEAGKSKLSETRAQISQGWRATGTFLIRQGHVDLAMDIRRFVEQMQSPQTDNEQIAEQLLTRVRQSRLRTQSPVR